MKHWLSLIGLLILPFLTTAQIVGEPYGSEWHKADSLLRNGFPESAAKIVRSIYDRANDKGQQVQVMKAQIYLISADFQRSEEAFQEAIKVAEQNASQEKFPNSAIWQSIAAQLYWTYYQQNRWQILGRTKVSGDVTIADIEHWDAWRFFDRASALYLSSIESSSALEKIDISQYDPIIEKGKNSRNRRPTLFDLLAFRALDYFQNDEKDLTRPAFAFRMDEAEAFSDASEFINHRFQAADTTSLQWKALKTYQRILRLHSDDANKDAYLDADLHRLQFAYNSSIHPQKKELYRAALERIERQYSANPISGMASIQIAQLMLGERTRMDYDQPLSALEKKPVEYNAILKKLDNILTRFPNSEAASRAKQMIQAILAKDLNIVTEEVVLPLEPSRVLINYRNVGQVTARIMRVDNSDNKWLGGYYRYDDERIDEVRKMPYLEQWTINLPAAGDHERHRAEMKVNPLPLGTYIVALSVDEKFSKKENLITYAVFQVSELSAVSPSNGSGYVLNRKTGAPIDGAAIDFFQQRYNDNVKGITLRRTSGTNSGSDGSFNYPNERNNSAIRIRKEKDTLLLSGYFHKGNTGNIEDRETTQTLFFTDRAIYRPGQTIFFKGIMLKKQDRGRKNTVVTGEETAVSLYDANGQKVESKSFTTNEFGSFNGSFIAPEGLLTGNMWISNSSGEVHFSVEEYKRPKFAVNFDTLQAAVKLGEEITIKGNAGAYAGNAIDNAEVKYRVVRNVRFPYWWYAYRWGFPRSAEMEIASGVVKTAPDGSFTVTFAAIPDPEVDSQSLPVFNYTVTADVTDVNGETRTGRTMVSAGYTSIQLSVNIPEMARPEDLDTISITSVNLNDQFVAKEVDLRISKLREPAQILRKRLWSAPDQFIMDSVSFKKDFPNDPYKTENDHLQWPIQRTVAEQKVATNREGMVALPKNIWNSNGWYVIEVSTRDKNGSMLTEKKYVRVWSEANEGSLTVPLAVLPQSQNREPGTEAVVTAVSGYDNLHLMRQVKDMNGVSDITPVVYDGKPVSWKRTVGEQDRGGIAIAYVTVKENRVYMQQAYVNVPWTNKDLNITWETHRDKLEPGAKETWTMVVRGSKKEKVAAEMVATLYDASLETFRPHQWQIHDLFLVVSSYLDWNTSMGFGQAIGMPRSYMRNEEVKHYEKSYDRLKLFGIELRYFGRLESANVRSTSDMYALAGATYQGKPKVAGARATGEMYVVDGLQSAIPNEKTDDTVTPDIVPRKNLRETAFFYPELKTDAEGNIRIQFNMPEALTQWKMMAFAHTKDMSYGMVEGTIRTQKELMVMPNLPRFLRQGDEIAINTKISNLSEKNLNGTATLEVINASTGQPMNLPFRIQQKDINFSVPQGGSTSASWILHVPESVYDPVTIRIRAASEGFTDGEENTIPVVSNRMLITETLPLWVNGNGSKTFTLDKLRNADTSNTLVHHSLTVEYTGNPAWLAVQSLPFLMEYPYECAEQVFNRYYAATLASHIVAQTPKIKAIFDRWKEEAMFSSLSSPLEKNEELKSALLEETPWVMEAKNESEQRRRLGELFDTHKLANELSVNARKLSDMQLPDGSFPWFKGMRSDRFITQYIITGLGRLSKLGVKDSKGDMDDIIKKALPYLDREIKTTYDKLVQSKAKLDAHQIGNSEVQYLYMRTFFNQPVASQSKAAVDYYTGQAGRFWSQFNPYMKGMIAIALHRKGDRTVPSNIMQSLKETAIKKEEMGMYWMQRGYSYWWYEAPIEAQSLLIECFREVANDNTSVDAMKVWLLKNKQTQSWETTKATADACYALLITGSGWLANDPKVEITLGKNETLSSENRPTEAGTGYFKQRYEGTKVKPEMGNVTIAVTANAQGTSWGAVYWQYFENLDKITGAKTPLQITKELFVERASDRGPVLHNISDASGPLKVGDKVVVRIHVVLDRDMEYVHMKDMRAAAFEPVNVISSYKWQSGLGYYESTKDLSTNFFFDYLRKGKYVFEYPMFVHQQGDFSNGIATIQCMYAPEFSSHSEGVRVQVQ